MMVSKLKCKVVRKGVPGIWGGCICWLLRWRWWARGQRNPMLIVWMAVIEFLSCHTVQHDVYMYYCHSRWDANLSYGHFCSPVLTKRDAWTSYEKQGHGEWCMLYHRDHRSKKTSMCWSLFELLNSKCATTTLACSTGTVPCHNLSSTNFLPPPTLFHHNTSMFHQRSATSQLKFNQLPSTLNAFPPLPSAMRTTQSSSTAVASKKKLSSDGSNPTDQEIGTTSNCEKYTNNEIQDNLLEHQTTQMV